MDFSKHFYNRNFSNLFDRAFLSSAEKTQEVHWLDIGRFFSYLFDFGKCFYPFDFGECFFYPFDFGKCFYPFDFAKCFLSVGFQ